MKTTTKKVNTKQDKEKKTQKREKVRGTHGG